MKKYNTHVSKRGHLLYGLQPMLFSIQNMTNKRNSATTTLVTGWSIMTIGYHSPKLADPIIACGASFA
jgi:hypothetical protein